MQRPWHEYEHNFQIMYKVGMGHKPPIPEKLSTEGKDFLGHCLESEPKRRWTASMLLDHPFVKVRHTAPTLKAVLYVTTNWLLLDQTLNSLESRVICWFRKSSQELLPLVSFRFAQMKSECRLLFGFYVYKLKHYCTWYWQKKTELWTLRRRSYGWKHTELNWGTNSIWFQWTIGSMEYWTVVSFMHPVTWGEGRGWACVYTVRIGLALIHV